MVWTTWWSKIATFSCKNMETLHVGNHFRMYSFVDVNAQAKTLINCSPNTSNDCNQLAVLCDVLDRPMDHNISVIHHYFHLICTSLNVARPNLPSWIPWQHVVACCTRLCWMRRNTHLMCLPDVPPVPPPDSVPPECELEEFVAKAGAATSSTGSDTCGASGVEKTDEFLGSCLFRWTKSRKTNNKT